MIKFKFISKKETKELPGSNGIYCFKKKKTILYIGKAINIKKRAKQHKKLLSLASQIGFIKTDSEIEALILEANLIKKYRPKYNIIWRDDKNYFYAEITNENLPRVLITHQKDKTPNKNSKFIGPFIKGKDLKTALFFLRRVFPYFTTKKHADEPCSWCHLGLCPGNNPDKEEYKKNIKNLTAVLSGKRKSVLKNLKQEMKTASIKQDFEKAAKARDRIAALEKTFANAAVFQKQPSLWNNSSAKKELQKILKTKNKISRIEAYDISNIQGKEASGSMVTFIDGLPDKNFYRRFKIAGQKPNDIAMIKEILKRRFAHLEWPLPDLILIDGGKAQMNIAIKSKNSEIKQQNSSARLKIAALAKKKNELFIEGRKNPVLLKKLPREIFNLILRLRDEAHRFAIDYHHKLRTKALIK